MKVTLVVNRKNTIKRIITNEDRSYADAMREARTGEKYWGWKLVTVETNKGYSEIADEWRRTHRG